MKTQGASFDFFFFFCMPSLGVILWVVMTSESGEKVKVENKLQLGNK